MEEQQKGPAAPARGEEVVLDIEDLSGEGKTVAKKDGMVYFVEDAVPGDTVRARIWKVQKKFAEARAVEVLRPSELRAEPQCRHFGVCGGCKWQNLAYDAQLRFKRAHVVEAFRRIGGFADPDVREVIGCPDPYYYRNKMEYTFSRHRWLRREEMEPGMLPPEEVALGLHVPKRYDKVVNLEECRLQSETGSAIVPMVREFAVKAGLTVFSPDLQEGYLRHLVVREGKRTGELMVNIVTSGDKPEVMQALSAELRKRFPAITTIVNNITSRRSMVAVGETEKVIFGPGYITERIGDYTFRVSANSFFQTNTLQAERLYATAKAAAALTPGDVVYDLYSGTGTIAIYMSGAVERVIGIEVVESAIADAGMNAEENRVANCYFLQGDLKDRLTKENAWLREHPRPTVVVADPPRSGMHAKVVEQIVKLRPSRIVYVSCNPSTQARDAALIAAGGYQLGEIQPVDMFPHTDHIEAVARFTRAGSAS